MTAPCARSENQNAKFGHGWLSCGEAGTRTDEAGGGSGAVD